MRHLLLLLSVLPQAVPARQLAPRIIAGTTVELQAAPWQASIVIQNAPLCSGAIVQENFVLTSGWCVHRVAISQLKVRVGSSTRCTGGSLIHVCGVHIHPHYNLFRYDNDLALLQLCENVTVVENKVQVIPLATETPSDSAEAIVSGWGYTSSSSWSILWRRVHSILTLLRLYWIDWLTTGSQQLQQAHVKILNVQQCARDVSIFGQFQPIQGISERTLCTTGGTAGACYFDQGAPLVANGSLVGILGKGGCAGQPDVYANLAEHRSWLQENTK
ncbi:trypsin alpha [Drosophila subobscura]|uniref:trypsin alpha n=1 Tax=Drosophila subobscura TaxID=7241 RepID=UPI00155AB6DD|nr:trypsin alpha [Drosophila subobscura]